MSDSYTAPHGPGVFRYSVETPATIYPLSEAEVIAQLRESLYFHGHNHRYFKAKADRLAAELATAREALQHAADAPVAA